MSTCWYYYTFPVATADRICGKASDKEERKLIKAVTDPDETDLDDDQIVLVKKLAREVLHKGISYNGKDDEQTEMLDNIVTTMFHWTGLEKELKLKPVSKEPMSVYLAEELVRAAGAQKLRLLATVLEGRRFGESSPAMCNYAFLRGSELSQLKSEAIKLRDNKRLKWKFPDTPRLIDETLIYPLDQALADPALGLFGHLS